ncbi:SPX-domain-containing protein [Lichtheimia hyalospora FSU 10163]|nr:SPX-domain-containing protein [Lichtheimia hyalospora FSU 10163]
MKFGSQLKNAIYPEWQSHYIDYDGLKKKLRKAEKDRPFTEKDETEFVEVLDANLEKVYAFHQQKHDEIISGIDSWDQVIASEPNASDMANIQEHINEIADDVNRLARFSRLNYTGFLKIVKKHDRHTNYILRPMFMVRLNQCPFWKQDDDALLIKLSELFSKVRDGGKQMSFKTPILKQSTTEYGDQVVDHRRVLVKRFFVHADNILELKTYVLRHLPVLVYRDNGVDHDDIDPPISSLYLDNMSLDSYNDRVESAEGSQVVRLRWYGSAKNNTSIVFERRTLADEEQGELTDRFIIKDKYVSGFLNGDQTFIQKTVNKMRNSLGKSEEDVEKFERFARDLQRMIKEKEMQPVLRTYYKRTAFQIPGDNRLRMALDTDLCFIREDTNLFSNDPIVRRPDGSWHRPDADIEYPFTNLKPESDVNRYPYATFEIKLNLAPGETEPEWIIDLEESGILEETHQFSKFVHGMALMFDTRVALLPYWLAQVDEDVEQLPVLPSQTPSVVKKTHKGKAKASPPLSNVADEDVCLVLEPATPRSPVNERTSLLGDQHQRGTTRYMGIMPSPPSSTDGSLQEEGYNWKDTLKTSWSQLVHRRKKTKYPPVVLPPGVKVPKKVVTPLRVEPKVFFANERTYFAWMSLGSLLSTFSIALFNAGDAVAKVCGIIYTLVSLSTLMYGMGLYYRRRELIRNKLPGPYDDISGPTAICIALLFAVGFNAYLKFTIHTPSLFYFH